MEKSCRPGLCPITINVPAPSFWQTASVRPRTPDRYSDSIGRTFSPSTTLATSEQVSRARRALGPAQARDFFATTALLSPAPLIDRTWRAKNARALVTRAGVGVAIVALSLDHTHWLLTLPLAVIAAALFGAAWAAIPAYLQAKRGSHIVITTIMFNYIAAALLVYLLNNVFKVPGSMAPESRRFGEGARIPRLDEMAGWFGMEMTRSPANISFFIALLACLGVWVLIWRTKLGYEIRAYGHSERAAVYAGIAPVWIVMITMLVSGGLAGLMATNTVMGDLQRLNLDSVLGAGFVGIAVALMGRSHPVGVILAALLFGVLYQGGAELAFEIPSIPSQMILTIQALVILFTGSLENMVRFPMERLFLWLGRGRA